MENKIGQRFKFLKALFMYEQIREITDFNNSSIMIESETIFSQALRFIGWVACSIYA